MREPKTSLIPLVVLFATFIAPLQLSSQSTAADHFANGKKLVEANCVDCMSGTQMGEEEGIRELETALQEHYGKPIDAYKLLADAYANMATYVGQSESQSKAFWHKQHEAYRKMYRLAPEDPEVLADYEQTLTDSNEKISICRKILTVKPTDAATWITLGELLLEQNNVTEGLQNMKHAVELESDPEAVRTDVQLMLAAFEKHQCPLQNAAAYNEEVIKAVAAAAQGEGDPKPMAAFKKNFVAALDHHTCTAPSAK